MKNETQALQENLTYLKLAWIRDHHSEEATTAAEKHRTHIDYLTRLIEGETLQRRTRAIERRIKTARFPLVKTLDQFDWNWPSTINRQQIQNTFTLHFIEEKKNLIFLGGVGLGKTHLATALGHQACLQGHRVLFTSAAEIINTLTAAQAAHRLKEELKKYIRPDLLIIDELGFLPIDKQGSDLLFQIISNRYERGSILLTSNKSYKTWPEVFNNDSVITAAILDRLLHHCETVCIEGQSYRMKDRIEPA
jgi:DNA replication protein DnaC